MNGFDHGDHRLSFKDAVLVRGERFLSFRGTAIGSGLGLLVLFMFAQRPAWIWLAAVLVMVLMASVAVRAISSDATWDDAGDESTL